MEIRSLGRLTSLIFAKFSGTVIDRGSYTLIQTPQNPGYHWGNYIIFNRPPQSGALKEWKALFDKEFTYYPEPHHYVFTWDTGRERSGHHVGRLVEEDAGDHQEFLDANFELDSATVLTATRLRPPPYENSLVEIRKISSDQDWEDVIKLQTLTADPKYMNDYYEQFKRRQMAEYRRMAEAGIGAWFGAYLKGQLVGDLGVFYEGLIGRYQNVGTHPEYRRQGICGTLVYRAGLTALNEFGVEQLVMEADINYHAARIYESVGFGRTEVNHALSWWKGKES